MDAFDKAWSVLKAARADKDKEWPEDYMFSWKEGGEPVTGRVDDAPYWRGEGPASMLPLTGVGTGFPYDWLEYLTSELPQPARSDPMKQPYIESDADMGSGEIIEGGFSAVPVSGSELSPFARASAANDGTFSTDLSDKRMQEKAKEWEIQRALERLRLRLRPDE